MMGIDNAIGHAIGHAIEHVGLFGGSFDPVHVGHLLAADSVQRQLSLDSLVLLPAARSPFKSSPEASDKDRLAMLSLAIEAHPKFRIDQRELLRPGPSYAIDTLREWVSERPENHYYLVIGMDAWSEFENWRAWPEILSLCHLCVMTRPDYAVAAMSLEWQQRQVTSIQKIRQSKAGKLLFVSVPASRVASSRIREKIKQGLGVEKDLSRGVREYIEHKGLYDPGKLRSDK